jgi:hypothetical protein
LVDSDVHHAALDHEEGRIPLALVEEQLVSVS